ncbi:MAG: hypothetical protein JKX99_12045 [Robiginitomaculum sp.]|nr:hypothetical protein [Robiginitomaculum sp.]
MTSDTDQNLLFKKNSKLNYQNIITKLKGIQNLKENLEVEKNKTGYLHRQLIISNKFNVEMEVHLLKEMRQKELLNREFTKMLISKNEKLISENQNIQISLAKMIEKFIDAKTQYLTTNENYKELDRVSDRLSDQLSETTENWLEAKMLVTDLKATSDWFLTYVSQSIEFQKELIDIHESNQTHKTQTQLRDYFIEKLKNPAKELEESLGWIQFYEKIDSKKPDEAIVKAQKATNKIKHLLSELELSEENITVNLKPYRLSPMINRLLREINKKYNVRFTYKIKDKECIIPCEVRKFRNAFTFVIESLIDLMDDRKNIDISIKNDTDKIHIEIKSSGYPLPELNTKEFFMSETTKNTDTKMKLIIAHKIIQAHKGEITCTQEPTIVTIKIPTITYLKENGFLDSYSKLNI